MTDGMEWTFILRLLVAGLLGTVIGLDREYRVKDAGFPPKAVRQRQPA